MTIAEITATINQLQELKRMQEELAAEIEAMQDKVKQEMGDRETLIAGPFKVTYKEVTTTRVDTTALKKALPEVAAQYSKTSTTRRFTIQ